MKLSKFERVGILQMAARQLDERERVEITLEGPLGTLEFAKFSFMMLVEGNEGEMIKRAASSVPQALRQLADEIEQMRR